MYTCQNLSTEDLIKQTNSQIYQLIGISGIEWILFPDINPLYIYKIGPLYKGDNSQFEGLLNLKDSDFSQYQKTS
jgi:hypothetical protein